MRTIQDRTRVKKEVYLSFMKLRIQGNSIRYRVSKSDLEKFGADGYIEDALDFGSKTFTYALNRLMGNGDLYAEYDNNMLVLHIPQSQADKWVGTELVGLETRQDIDGFGRELHLLLEKDFKCLGKEGDSDQKDMFENPKSGC